MLFVEVIELPYITVLGREKIFLLTIPSSLLEGFGS